MKLDSSDCIVPCRLWSLWGNLRHPARRTMPSLVSQMHATSARQPRCAKAAYPNTLHGLGPHLSRRRRD